MATDLNTSRGTITPKPTDEWVAERFGTPQPDLLPVPDLDPDAEYDVMKTFYETWGPTIRANSVALAVWNAEQQQARRFIRTERLT